MSRALVRRLARYVPRRAACVAARAHSTVHGASVDPSDIAHFSRLAEQWWDEEGEFAPLHKMNRVRIDFLREKLSEVRGWDAAVADVLGRAVPPALPAQFLTDVDMLDIGCGGGLLAESAARLGARVTGVDASEANIRMAAHHAAQDPALQVRCAGVEDAAPSGAAPSITYVHASAEALRDAGRTYDVVTAMEVIEHVNEPASFLRCLADLIQVRCSADLTQPGGHLFLSTMSRTALSYLLTIFLAEDMLGVVSRGTHRHAQYIHPHEMVGFFRELGWIRPPDMARRERLPDGAPIAPVPPRLQFETRGTMYVPVLGQWVLARPSVADANATGAPPAHRWLPEWLGGGMRPTELCNYFFWVRKPLD